MWHSCITGIEDFVKLYTQQIILEKSCRSLSMTQRPCYSCTKHDRDIIWYAGHNYFCTIWSRPQATTFTRACKSPQILVTAFRKAVTQKFTYYASRLYTTLGSIQRAALCVSYRFQNCEHTVLVWYWFCFGSMLRIHAVTGQAAQHFSLSLFLLMTFHCWHPWREDARPRVVVPHITDTRA